MYVIECGSFGPTCVCVYCNLSYEGSIVPYHLMVYCTLSYGGLLYLIICSLSETQISMDILVLFSDSQGFGLFKKTQSLYVIVCVFF